MSCERRFLAEKDAPRSPGVRRESSASVNVPILPRLLRGLCVSVVSDSAKQSQFAGARIDGNHCSGKELGVASPVGRGEKRSQFGGRGWGLPLRGRSATLRGVAKGSCGKTVVGACRSGQVLASAS
jgi:hypothetical protein